MGFCSPEGGRAHVVLTPDASGAIFPHLLPCAHGSPWASPNQLPVVHCAAELNYHLSATLITLSSTLHFQPARPPSTSNPDL